MNAYARRQQGSALIISIFITGILIVAMIGLLDRIVPMSRNVRWIENSTVAYYKSASEIENALATMNLKNPGHTVTGSPNASTLPSLATTSTGGYKISELTYSVPTPGQWTSEYDKNWNQIAPGAPVQIFIPASFGASFPNEFQLDLRVPRVQDKTSGNADVLTPLDSPGTRFFTGSISYPVVFWILSDGKNTLMPNMSTLGSSSLSTLYDASSVNRLNTAAVTQFASMAARDSSDGTTGTIASLYASKLGNCVASGCTLKLTVANALKSESDQTLPYLEYRIRRVANLGALSDVGYFGYWTDTIGANSLGLTKALPSQYATIDAEGYSIGFKRTKTKKLQQLTTSEALDFTVFQ